MIFILFSDAITPKRPKLYVIVSIILTFIILSSSLYRNNKFNINIRIIRLSLNYYCCTVLGGIYKQREAVGYSNTAVFDKYNLLVITCTYNVPCISIFCRLIRVTLILMDVLIFISDFVSVRFFQSRVIIYEHYPSNNNINVKHIICYMYLYIYIYTLYIGKLAIGIP